MHPTNINNIFHVNHILFPLQGFSIFTYYRQSANHGQTEAMYLQEKGKLSLLPSVYHHFQQSVIVSETETWGWASLRTVHQLSLKCLVQSEKEAKTQINTHLFHPLEAQLHTRKRWIHRSETHRECKKVRFESCASDWTPAAPKVATYMLLFVLFIPCNSVPLFFWSRSLVQRCRRRGTRNTVKPIVVQSCHRIYWGSRLVLEQKQMTV